MQDLGAEPFPQLLEPRLGKSGKLLLPARLGTSGLDLRARHGLRLNVIVHAQPALRSLPAPSSRPARTARSPA
jgi:hypothetical protein